MRVKPIYNKSFIYSFDTVESRTKCILKLLMHQEVRNTEISCLKSTLHNIIVNENKDFYINKNSKKQKMEALSETEIFNLLTNTSMASFALSVESEDAHDVYMYYYESDTKFKLVVETCSDYASEYIENVVTYL